MLWWSTCYYGLKLSSVVITHLSSHFLLCYFFHICLWCHVLWFNALESILSGATIKALCHLSFSSICESLDGLGSSSFNSCQVFPFQTHLFHWASIHVDEWLSLKFYSYYHSASCSCFSLFCKVICHDDEWDAMLMMFILWAFTFMLSYVYGLNLYLYNTSFQALCSFGFGLKSHFSDT
jgi:hypothetical protein